MCYFLEIHPLAMALFDQLLLIVLSTEYFSIVLDTLHVCVDVWYGTVCRRS